MIGGRHPFRQPSTGETLAAVLHAPPDLGGDIPHGVMALIKRLLAKRPEDRYASAAEVSGDLAGLAASPAAVAHQKARAGVAGWLRRPAAGVLAMVSVGVAAFVVAGYGFLRPGSRVPAVAVAPGLIRSIAVLPLDNYSGDLNQDYFAEGMTDRIDRPIWRASANSASSRANP